MLINESWYKDSAAEVNDLNVSPRGRRLDTIGNVGYHVITK
jgi:hypothetical protein